MKVTTPKICPKCRAVFAKGWKRGRAREGDADVLNQLDAAIKDKAGEIVLKSKSGTLHLKPNYVLCDVCSRSKSGYFEGILQLRNLRSPVHDIIYNQIVETISSSRTVFIAKAVKQKDGVDFYLSSNKFLISLGKKLHNDYGGDMKKSKKLHTRNRQTSKEVYRVTVLIRAPNFGTGDLVTVKNKIILVSKVQSGFIMGIDLSADKKTKILYCEPDSIVHQSDFMEALVVRHKPVLEVIHPTTYQPVGVENPRPIEGDRVKVAVIKDKLFLLP